MGDFRGEKITLYGSNAFGLGKQQDVVMILMTPYEIGCEI